MKPVSTLILLILLMGCATATVGRPFDQEQLAKIEKGRTTRGEVLQYLGAPSHIVTLSDGRTKYIYSYAETTTNMLAGTVNTKSQATSIVFGPDQIVSDLALPPPTP